MKHFPEKDCRRQNHSPECNVAVWSFDFSVVWRHLGQVGVVLCVNACGRPYFQAPSGLEQAPALSAELLSHFIVIIIILVAVTMCSEAGRAEAGRAEAGRAAHTHVQSVNCVADWGICFDTLPGSIHQLRLWWKWRLSETLLFCSFIFVPSFGHMRHQLDARSGGRGHLPLEQPF